MAHGLALPVARALAACALTAAALITIPAARACMPSTVDFAFGSARLEPAALEEVAYVADQYRRGRYAAVRVRAQSDGSAANLRMARRRGEAVKAALVRLGVPARAVITETVDMSQAARTGQGFISGEGSARLVVFELVAARPSRTESGTC